MPKEVSIKPAVKRRYANSKLLRPKTKVEVVVPEKKVEPLRPKSGTKSITDRIKDKIANARNNKPKKKPSDATDKK